MTKTTLTLLRTSDGVITARRLNEPRQEGSFDQIQIFNLLTEINLGCSLDSVRVVPKINRVEISLQNLVFRAFFFQTQCVNDLQKFVAPIAFETAKKFNLDDLLGDSGRPLTRSAFKVGQSRAKETTHVDAMMVIKLTIFNGKYRLKNRLRNLAQQNGLTVLEFISGDLITSTVVHIRSFRNSLPCGKRDRRLFVGIGDLPEAWSDANDCRCQHKCSRHNDDAQPHPPGDHSHNSSTVVGSSG